MVKMGLVRLGVKRVITGTRTRPASMQNAPALMGDCRITGKLERTKMLASMTTVEKIKLTQTERTVAPRQYRPIPMVTEKKTTSIESLINRSMMSISFSNHKITKMSKNKES